MLLTIDGETLQAGSIPGENLEEILVVLQDSHIPGSRLVGDVRLNGQSYSEDLPHAAVEIGRSDIETLEVITRSAEEVAAHFLENGVNLLTVLMESVPRIVEIFRVGDEAEANEHFLRFLESLHLLIGMLDQVGAIMGLHFNTALPQDVSLNERLLKMAGIMDQIIDIQENSDWIYLADVLEYELVPELEALRDMLPKFREGAH